MPEKPDVRSNLWYRQANFFFLSKLGQLQIRYGEVDIYFKISRSSKMDGDKCDIQIYNLNKNTLDKINQFSLVLIEAGYKYGLTDLVFRGDITKIYSIEGGTDICTHIVATDTTRAAIDTCYKQRTYKKGTPFINILEQELNDWNENIKSDERYNYNLERTIHVGRMEDPNEYYGLDIFKLEKDETKTQTPYGVIKDIVDRTNGLIWRGVNATQQDKEWIQKNSISGLTNGEFLNGRRRKSWTFYIQETKFGVASSAFFVSISFTQGEHIKLDADHGLLEITPDDYLERHKGWSGKCLLDPRIKPSKIIKCIPARKKGWGPVLIRVDEMSHELADGGVFYTTFKGNVFDEGDKEIV